MAAGYFLRSSVMFTEVFIYRRHGGYYYLKVHFLQSGVPAKLIFGALIFASIFHCEVSSDTSVVLGKLHL